MLFEKPLLDTTAEDFDRLIAVNLRGTFLVGREALRVMVAQKRGRVINIASELAYLGRARMLGLLRLEGRRGLPDPLLGAGVRARHPGQCHRPRPHRYADARRREHERGDAGQEADNSRSAASAGRRRSPPPPCSSPTPANSFMTGQCISPNGGAVMF